MFFWNTIFIVFSAKHSSCNRKAVCWKKTENLWKIVGCFWTWQNGVFWFVFWGFFMVLWFVFVCLVKLQKWLNMFFCFPVIWAFVGWVILVYLGLQGLGVLWFLFWFFFCSGFVFLCFGFVSVLLLVLFLFFAFYTLFFVLCYFGGFKGQVRWPKGPPHVALNPTYVCLFLFFFLFFWFLWRV